MLYVETLVELVRTQVAAIKEEAPGCPGIVSKQAIKQIHRMISYLSPLLPAGSPVKYGGKSHSGRDGRPEPGGCQFHQAGGFGRGGRQRRQSFRRYRSRIERPARRGRLVGRDVKLRVYPSPPG